MSQYNSFGTSLWFWWCSPGPLPVQTSLSCCFLFLYVCLRFFFAFWTVCRSFFAAPGADARDSLSRFSSLSRGYFMLEKDRRAPSDPRVLSGDPFLRVLVFSQRSIRLCDTLLPDSEIFPAWAISRPTQAVNRILFLFGFPLGFYSPPFLIYEKRAMNDLTSLSPKRFLDPICPGNDVLPGFPSFYALD